MPETTTQTNPSVAVDGTITLDITGMTCAACAAGIERKLNQLEGVNAAVNYATERATVTTATATVDDLISVVEATGYHARPHQTGAAASPEQSDRTTDLRRRLIVATILGLPVLLLSMVPAFQFDGWQWVALVLATPVATWSAWPFHRAMALNLAHRQATMDTLVSVGVIAAYGWSVWALFATAAGNIGMKMSMSFDIGGASSGHHIYLEVASTVVALILAGRYFEARSKRAAGAAIRALLDLGADEVSLIDESGRERRVPAETLAVGDRFVVRPGEKIATDGVVVDGRSAVDQSLVTGESLPVEVGPQDLVIGATINQQGRLLVTATQVGNDTQLAQIARLVEDAQSGKAPIQRLADRVSAVFVPIVIVLSLITLGAWFLITGDVERSFSAAVAVLIIACPCALGLATPTALLVGTGRGAQLGVLIKGPEILESTKQVDTILLDKTGTVTTGKMTLTEVAPLGFVEQQQLLRIAGAVEAASEHPIATTIVAAARQQLGDLPPVDDFENTPGVGVSATIAGVRYRVGRPATDTQLADTQLDGVQASHATVVEVARLNADGTTDTVGHLMVSDRPKHDSKSAIEALRDAGLDPWLLTGDHYGAAIAVADEVGIAADHVIAGVLPAQKSETVQKLRQEGRVVAMVGDGVNDAAALAAADLGLAMGAGTDVAIEASDITLTRSDLSSVVSALQLSRRTLATIKGNLFWAFAYNVLAIPLAMSGQLSPAIAGAAMAFSSVFVVSNSLRLRRFGR